MFGIFFLLKKQQKRGGEEEKRKRKQKNLKQPGQSRSQRSRNFVNQQNSFVACAQNKKKSLQRGEKNKKILKPKKKKIDAYCILYFDANLFAKSIQIYPFPFKVSESFFSFHAFFFFLSFSCVFSFSFLD